MVLQARWRSNFRKGSGGGRRGGGGGGNAYDGIELAGEDGPFAEVARARHAGQQRRVSRGAEGQEDFHQLVTVKVVVQNVVARADALGLSFEWGGADQHLEHDASHSPLVHLRGVVVVTHDKLGSTIPESDELSIYGNASPPFSSKTEITHLG